MNKAQFYITYIFVDVTQHQLISSNHAFPILFMIFSPIEVLENFPR